MSTTKGYLLIADITGYTLYLSESELEHAQQVLTVLLELLVTRTRPPLIINRLAGDAVISYGLGENFLQGQTFMEVIEESYTAFRAAIERMVLNNTCRCNACTNIGHLDLKFFVHFGTFALQHIRDRDELVGSDVNLIHRLLKNHVTEKTGIRAYTLYTEAAIQQLGLTAVCRTMQPHTEAYEHLGEVSLWVQDMHPVWEEKRAATRIPLDPKEVFLQVEAEIEAPPDQVWEYLAQPEHRGILMGAAHYEVTNVANGRIGPGAVFQCYHGDHVTPQTIVEWRPFERIVEQDRLPVPIPNTFCLIEYLATPTERGTRVRQTFFQTSGPWLGQKIAQIVFRGMKKQCQADVDKFKRHVEAHLAGRTGFQKRAVAVPVEWIGQAITESLQPAG